MVWFNHKLHLVLIMVIKLISFDKTVHCEVLFQMICSNNKIARPQTSPPILAPHNWVIHALTKSLRQGHDIRWLWVSCQIRKVAGCACDGNTGNVSPPPRVSVPDMHHGTCVMHVPWCMQGSLTSSILWSRWRGKRSRHSRRMRNPQIYISGKRPMSY